MSFLDPGVKERYDARNQVAEALRKGVLTSPDHCEMCGGDNPGGVYQRFTAHHENYSQPLIVAWLCVRCHRKIHGPGLCAYLAQLRAQLSAAERLHGWLIERGLDREGDQ